MLRVRALAWAFLLIAGVVVLALGYNGGWGPASRADSHTYDSKVCTIRRLNSLSATEFEMYRHEPFILKTAESEYNVNEAWSKNRIWKDLGSQEVSVGTTYEGAAPTLPMPLHQLVCSLDPICFVINVAPLL
jgi:hypothetical protein